MTFFHLFTPKEEKKSGPLDQQKKFLNWFLFFWLGFIGLQYLLPRLGDLPQLLEQLQLVNSKTSISVDKGGVALLALGAFALLMVLHGGLHGLALFKNLHGRWLWPYFLLQIGGIWLIYAMTDGEQGSGNVLLALCLLLAFEAIILCKRLSMISIIVAGCLLFYLAFQAYNLFALSQQQLPVAPKLIGSIAESSTMIPFVCASFVLYFQQGRAHQRDQALLRELETAHIQLEDYAARVQDLTLTAERQRLARELHDTLAQGLVGLTMQLETIDSLLLMQRGEQARAIVQQAMSRSRATITSARSAIADLRTEAQEARDILDAIEEEAEHFTQATGIACAYHLEAQLPQEQQEHLLRTVSEGLTNIARHSRASQAWIRTGRGKEGVTLEIGDNGIGFEPTEVVAGHYGLLGLRERARLMNAHLAVSSSPGRGTQVCLCLPAESGGVQ